jgi:hypothetical protein
MGATHKFNLLAYQQTLWQSRNNEKRENNEKQFGSDRTRGYHPRRTCNSRKKLSSIHCHHDSNLEL